MIEVELEAFNAQAYIEDLNTARDMINATYDQGKYYVINSFAHYADQERLGKELFMAKRIAWNKKKIKRINFTAYAEKIRKTSLMIETPYGIAGSFHGNSMKLYT